MKKAEFIACLLWLALAFTVCLGSLQLKLGTPSEPGSGFLPFHTALLLGILALVHLIQITCQRTEDRPPEPLLGNAQWGRAMGVVVALISYALLLPYLGYIVGTFLLMVTLFSIYERKSWGMVLTLTILTLGVTYILFHNWLKVQFPIGILGIG